MSNDDELVGVVRLNLVDDGAAITVMYDTSKKSQFRFWNGIIPDSCGLQMEHLFHV